MLIAPDLREAARLLDAGMRLVALHPNTKRPMGDDWNHRPVMWIEPSATGYGLLLEANKLCSIDPDRVDLARIGMAALGFNLEELMEAGVRTQSTRLGSGGRSTFRAEGDISWLAFRSKETGIVIEFRAHSPNLQDTIPGVVYESKDGKLCTQEYANDRRLDDCPPIPDNLYAWWERCSTDLEFRRQQEQKFFDAISARPTLSISGGKSGTTLAYDAPGVRGPFNAAHGVAEILARHGYVRDDRTDRWSPPSATGAPGVRLIPGKDDLWASDHASDPLLGVFDAWVAHVTLDHDGNVETATAAWLAAQTRGPQIVPAPAEVTVNAAAAIDTDEDDEILAERMPTIDPIAFYGPLRPIVEAATQNSEATKVGVAISVIVQISMLLRPFFVPLGDDRPGLNLFMLQVGQSALARKGTSAELANARLAPMLRAKAKALKAEIDRLGRDADHRRAAINAAESALELAHQRHAQITAVTPERLEFAKAWLDDEEAQLADRRKALEKFKKKREEAYGSRGYEIRGKSLSAGEAGLKDKEAQAEPCRQYLAMGGAYLADQDQAVRDMQAEIASLQQVLDEARAAAETAPDGPAPYLVALADLASTPVTLTGVSSGEGIIDAIRDAATKPDQYGNLDRGVAEKRMLIDLSEYGSMLSLMRRPGNTLSAVMRDAYDGRPLATNSKNSPVKCYAPHISMNAAITPAELRSLMFDAKDSGSIADNGVGNRNLYAYVKREKLVSRPQPTRGIEQIVERMWTNIVRVYQELEATTEPRSIAFEFTEDGALAWDTCYVRLTQRIATSPNAGQLHGRFEINCRKVACIFAAMNGESKVSAAAVHAAFALISHCAATVDAVMSTANERQQKNVLIADATKVFHALQSAGGAASAREVSRMTSLKKDRRDAAARYLANMTSPSAIIIESRPTAVGNGATRMAAWFRIARPQ